MTNLEKLLKNGFDNSRDLDCVLYEKRMGKNCTELPTNTNCPDCRRETLEWLQQEYKPKYNWLENGDNLKPGDQIMITANKSAEPLKRRFLFYKDGKFYTNTSDEEIGRYGQYMPWYYARFPEEGE